MKILDEQEMYRLLPAIMHSLKSLKLDPFDDKKQKDLMHVFIDDWADRITQASAVPDTLHLETHVEKLHKFIEVTNFRPYIMHKIKEESLKMRAN